MTAKSDDELVNWIKLWAGDRLRGWRSRDSGYMQYRRRLVDSALVSKAKLAEAMFMVAALSPKISKETAKKVAGVWKDLWEQEQHEGPSYHYAEQTGMELAELAGKGDPDAAAALSGIAAMLLPEMPRDLEKHTRSLFQEKFESTPMRRKGGDRHANTARNLFIVDSVSALHRGGIHPTQNRASRDRGKSGCAIVAKALAGIGIHIDATGVEKVWAGRSRYVRR